MAIKINNQYILEKIDAYNVAIEALRLHESDADVPCLSSRLRMQLADKLDREIQRWCNKNMPNKPPDDDA